MNYINKNPSFIFHNFHSYKKNSVINFTRNKQKLEKHIDNSMKVFNDFSDNFINQMNIHPDKINELKIKKSFSEKHLMEKNNTKFEQNNISIYQKIMNKKILFPQNHSKNNKNKIKCINSKKKNHKSFNNISDNLNLSNNYSKRHKFILKNNSSNHSIIKRNKEKKINHKRIYYSLLKQLDYDGNLFKRNPSIDLIINYSKKNFKRSTFSSKSNEKRSFIKDNENYSLIKKKGKTILQNIKSIKNKIKIKLSSEKKFYEERQYFHSAKQRKIKSLIKESKFIDNINKKKQDNIKDIAHYINFSKLKKDLNFVYQLNNSVVYSQRHFLKQKYENDKEKTINYYYNKFFFD